MSVIEAGTQPAVMAETGQGFDYAQIDEGIRDEVRQAARSIHSLGKAMKSSIIGIGKRLIEVKGMLDHGQFGPWCKAEFDMSERTAERMMNVARTFELKSDIMSFLSDTVMYMLAAPSTPEAARQEIEQRAAAGEQITVATAHEVIDNHKPQKAAVQFAPAKPPQHKPEPVAHHQGVEALEGWVVQWLNIDKPNSDHDMILDTIASGKPGYSFDRLTAYLRERFVAWRDGDLRKAIANVREQRRQAKRQETARVVYTEPVEPPRAPVPDAVVPLEVPDDLAAAGFTFLHDARGWRYIWSPRPTFSSHSDNYRSRSGMIAAARRELKSSVKPEPTPALPSPSKVEIINRDLDAYEAEAQREVEQWRREDEVEPDTIVRDLMTLQPASNEFDIALQSATVEQLSVAMETMIAPPQSQAATLITIAIPQPLLSALHSDLLAHYPGRKLSVGDCHALAAILWRAIESAPDGAGIEEGEGSDG